MKHLYLLIIIIFFCAAAPVFAQQAAHLHSDHVEVKPQNITISYGEKLSPTLFADPNMPQTTFIIKNNKNKILATGVGREVADFVYEKPGQYQVTITINPAIIKAHEGQCFHHSVPENIMVTVSDSKATFLFDQMRFKNPLTGEIEQQGNIVYIPVQVQSYHGKAVDFCKTVMHSAGVGANVTGYLANKNTKLKPGRHVLEYHLKGRVMKGSYIMLDITDPAGYMQSVAIKEIIE